MVGKETRRLLLSETSYSWERKVHKHAHVRQNFGENKVKQIVPYIYHRALGFQTPDLVLTVSYRATVDLLRILDYKARSTGQPFLDWSWKVRVYLLVLVWTLIKECLDGLEMKQMIGLYPGLEIPKTPSHRRDAGTPSDKPQLHLQSNQPSLVSPMIFE